MVLLAFELAHKRFSSTTATKILYDVSYCTEPYYTVPYDVMYSTVINKYDVTGNFAKSRVLNQLS
jgi:hypothetical protein